MTFGKNRFKKQSNEWEMIRFCNKLNTNIIGGASKLFKHFLQNHFKLSLEFLSLLNSVNSFSILHLVQVFISL
jgi:hypothetical protein